MMTMRVRWLSASRRDVVRLHAFLKDVSPRTATRIPEMLNAAAKALPEFPQKGLRLEDFLPRDVRALIIGDYELRYELAGGEIIILRIWHTREDR